MTPAAKLQEYLMKRVKDSGGQYRKVRWVARRGCPDCFIWWEWPRAAFIEIKAADDTIRPEQRREIQRMQRYGLPVFIARSIADLEEIIEKVRKL